MTKRRILFGDFEFEQIRGLEYLLDAEKSVTDYLFVNDPHGEFSMYFEKGFPMFSVPENGDREYCLFEIKHSDRRIKFFCPERHKNLDSVVWYFYVELCDEEGGLHGLPGQIRVKYNGKCLRHQKSKLCFIEVLERVKLIKKAATA